MNYIIRENRALDILIIIGPMRQIRELFRSSCSKEALGKILYVEGISVVGTEDNSSELRKTVRIRVLYIFHH